MEERTSVTWPDVEELMRSNPLAAEQLKNIVLRRMLADAERRSAAADDAGADEMSGPGADDDA